MFPKPPKKLVIITLALVLSTLVIAAYSGAMLAILVSGNWR